MTRSREVVAREKSRSREGRTRVGEALTRYLFGKVPEMIKGTRGC